MTHYSPFVFSCSAPTPVNDLLSNKIGPRPAAVASAPSTRKQRSIRCWSDLTMPFSLHHPPRPSLILPVPSVPTMKMMMQVPPYSQSLHEHQIEWTTEQSAPARAWSECNSAHQLCLWSTNGGSFLVWWGRCYMIDFLHNFLFFFVTMALEMLGLYLSNVIVENSFCNIQTWSVTAVNNSFNINILYTKFPNHRWRQ